MKKNWLLSLLLIFVLLGFSSTKLSAARVSGQPNGDSYGMRPDGLYAAEAGSLGSKYHTNVFYSADGNVWYTTVWEAKAITTSAWYGWHSNSYGWWYGRGNSYKVGWAKINGVWFWFNRSGYVNGHYGWEKGRSGWYYSNGGNGYFTSVTKTISGRTYYFDTYAIAHAR